MKSKQTDYADLPNRLLLNVSSTDLSLNYKYSLDKAISNELWEFGVTVIWKFVVLFFYEKLFQLHLLDQLHQNFINELDKHRQDCHNCFSFNCMRDDDLFKNMNLIWRNVDGNFRNLFKRLLFERNSLSHVNEYPHSENKFWVYGEDALNLLNYLQSLHLQLNLEKTHEHIHAHGDFSYLSALEIEQLLNKWVSDTELLIYLTSLIPLGQIQDDWIKKIKDVAIEQFTTAGSFAGARIKGLKLIKPLVPYFEKTDFSKIIGTLIKVDNRQVLLAGGIEEVFTAMYVECVNNFPDLEEEWLRFLEGVEEAQATDYFKELKILVG